MVDFFWRDESKKCLVLLKDIMVQQETMHCLEIGDPPKGQISILNFYYISFPIYTLPNLHYGLGGGPLG